MLSFFLNGWECKIGFVCDGVGGRTTARVRASVLGRVLLV